MIQTGEIRDKTEGHLQHGGVQARLKYWRYWWMTKHQWTSSDGRCVMKRPPPTSSNQLDAVETLHTLFEEWKLLAPPALLNDSRAVCVPRASPALQSPCRVHDMTPAVEGRYGNSRLGVYRRNLCEVMVSKA